MDVGVVERMLRGLPGVLDCSVSDEGIAVVVHPEVDPRMLELRAQTALAELGERRPLLVVGGMTAAAAAGMGAGMGAGGARGMPRGVHRVPRNRSSMPVIGFAVLVVAALTVLPLANRDTSSPGDKGAEVAAPTPAPAAGAAPTPVARPGVVPSFGPLAITDDRVAAALAPAMARPLRAAVDTARFVRRAAADVPRTAVAPPPPPASAAVDAGTATPVVPGPASVAAADHGKKSGNGKGRSVGFAAAADSGGTDGKAGARRAGGKGGPHKAPKPPKPGKARP